MIDLDWVPDGWTRESYAGECERMAAACRAVRPDLADEWSARAAALRNTSKTTTPKNALEPHH